MNTIELLKLSIPIESIIGSVIELRNGKGLCPFHNDRNPSFSVKGDKWRCWSCGIGGDVVDFVERCYNLTTAKAVQFIAGKGGLSPSTLTTKERAALEKANKERQTRKALMAAFRTWERQSVKETSTILRALRGVKTAWADFSETGLQDLAEVQAEIDYIDYFYMDVLNGPAPDRLALYLKEGAHLG